MSVIPGKKVHYERKTTEHEYSKGIERADYYEIPHGFDVFGWSPAPPGTKDAPMTQVHLHFGSPPGQVFVVRFKGPDGLDALIDTLAEHRESVWGKR